MPDARAAGGGHGGAVRRSGGTRTGHRLRSPESRLLRATWQRPPGCCLSPARSRAGARWPGTTGGRSSPLRQTPGSCRRRRSSSPRAARCGPTARGAAAAACPAQRPLLCPACRRCCWQWQRHRCRRCCRLPAAARARPTGAGSGRHWQRPAGGRMATSAPWSQSGEGVDGRASIEACGHRHPIQGTRPAGESRSCTQRCTHRPILDQGSSR